MEIGLYGIHQKNMDQLSADMLFKQVKRVVYLYVVILILAAMLPSRVTREEFENEKNGNATLLVKGADEGVSYYLDGGDGERFFRFRKLLTFDNEALDDFEVLISELSALELKITQDIGNNGHSKDLIDD